jgi:hypothetical protein
MLPSPEALALAADQVRAEQLDGDASFEAASRRWVRQPDGAHAALAEGRDERAGADALALHRGGQRGRRFEEPFSSTTPRCSSSAARSAASVGESVQGIEPLRAVVRRQ